MRSSRSGDPEHETGKKEENDMQEQNERELIVLSSRGLDDERAIVAWTIANVAINSGQRVTMFLVSSGVDVVRRGAAKHMQLNPSDPPLQELVDNFVARQGTIWVCPPCAEYRGYDAASFIEGVEVVGSGPMHDKLKAGAASLCF
jgi:predicted peroxiredoxin